MPTKVRLIARGAEAPEHDETAELLPLDVALQRGLRLVTPVCETRQVALGEAAGRITAAELRSTMALPPFDNSAMDGYAVNVCELTGDPPYKVPVFARVAAGDSGHLTPEPGRSGGAVRILTGAPVPPGFDAVIMQEHCRRDGDEITLARRPAPGDNIRRKGGDCQSGSVIIEAGVELDSRHIALISALGLPRVTVGRKVRVALFCTGSELRQPGEPLGAGQIYNSNRYMLAAALCSPAIDLADLGAVRDEPELLKAVLEKAVADSDVVITTGGVSVGDEDHMPRLVEEAGGTIHVMKVAIKPGKPVTIGTIGKAIYIGLPGNPVAAFVTHLLIAQPIIQHCAGRRATALSPSPARAAFERQRRPGRQEYLPARVIGTSSDGRPLLEAFRKAGSATLLPLALADGFAVVPADQAVVARGDPIGFLRFS